MPTLHLFLRKSYSDQYSIEKLFNGLVPFFKENGAFDVKILSMPYASQGLFNRLKNLWFTYQNRGDVNHVTGDIHFIVFALPRKRTILTIHDCATAMRLKGIKLLFFNLLWLKWPTQWVKNITVISEKTKIDLVAITKINRKKITVIPNYIHPSFTPGLTSDSPIFNILHIGTAKHKNWHRLAQAVSGINCLVTIVGTLDKMDIAFLKYEKVNYINKTNLTETQLIDEYRNAHIVHFTSTFEGFGMPILEAQAIGKPVLSSRMEPMISVAGPGAILVNPFDTGQIRNKLLNILLNPNKQKSIILAGLNNVQSYSLPEIAHLYINYYKIIASNL